MSVGGGVLGGVGIKGHRSCDLYVERAGDAALGYDHGVRRERKERPWHARFLVPKRR